MKTLVKGKGPYMTKSPSCLLNLFLLIKKWRRNSHAMALRPGSPFLFKCFMNMCHVTLSCVQLFETPWTVAHQAPLSLDSPGKSTRVGCHCLLQYQGLNILYCKLYSCSVLVNIYDLNLLLISLFLITDGSI